MKRSPSTPNVSEPGYRVFRGDELEFAAPSGGDQTRGILRLSDALGKMRANVWRLPPGARGRRHRELVQEEVFVVLDGSMTAYLGDPAERVELPIGSMLAVAPGTALQLRNESDADARLFAYGAPPERGAAEFLPEIE
jgi:uncharacterized cupin superfamily protein